jgi:hypothetical protein
MHSCIHVCIHENADVLLHVPRMLIDAPLILSARQRRRNMHVSHVCGLAPSHPDSRAPSCAYLPCTPCTPCVHCMCRFTRRRYRRRTRTRTFVRHTPIPMQIRLCACRYRKIRARAPTRILCRYARMRVMHACTVWMYGCMDVWMDVWMYGWMDGWMCGCRNEDVCIYG